MEESNHLHWPVLSHYDQEHTGRIALPIGGIGTGTVSLSGRGNLQDWEIANRPAKGFNPNSTFGHMHAGPAEWWIVQVGAISGKFEGFHGGDQIRKLLIRQL